VKKAVKSAGFRVLLGSVFLAAAGSALAGPAASPASVVGDAQEEQERATISVKTRDGGYSVRDAIGVDDAEVSFDGAFRSAEFEMRAEGAGKGPALVDGGLYVPGAID
jgi:hypothetical protein